MYHKHSKHESKKYSILVNEDELSSINKFLLKYFKVIEFGGKTNDNTQLKFDDIDELFEYPNHKERKLIKIDLDCREGIQDEKAGLSISFGNSYSIDTETIRYYLRYNNIDWGFRFDDELDKHLRELKTWYSPLTKFNLTIGVPIGFLVLMMLYGGIDGTLKIFGYSGYIEYSDTKDDGQSLFGYILAIILFVIGYLLERFKEYLFPKSFIALGKQKKTYNQRQTITYMIFGVIILGIAINLVSSWIYSG